MIIGIIILVVVCGVIGWFISTSNSINRANNKIKNIIFPLNHLCVSQELFCFEEKKEKSKIKVI